MKKNQNAPDLLSIPQSRGKMLVKEKSLFLTLSVLVPNPKTYLIRWTIPLVVCYKGKKENTSIQEKTVEFSRLHRHLIFSFVYWYNRQILLLLMICMCIYL